jgi:hypothetical protein
MSLLDQVRKLERQVVDRLKELEPLTREYEQLRKVAQRLGIEYSPRSEEGAAKAKPSTTASRGRGRAGAGKRAARTPAKARAGGSAARARAAKPATTPRSARSTTGQRAASRAEPARASGTAAPSRPRKRAGSSGQLSGRHLPPPPRPGQRDDDMLRLAIENPGITVREIGERLGVDATGLYRVAERLTDAGRLRKDGPRLYPAEAATPSPAPASAGGGTSQAPSSDAVKPREATARPASEPSTNAGDGAGSNAS